MIIRNLMTGSFLAMLLFPACDPSCTLDFVNNSDIDLRLYYNSVSTYDTVLRETEPNFISVAPASSERVAILGRCRNLFPLDSVVVFFFDADTLDEYSWEVIRNEYKVVKRYGLSKIKLEQDNWTVVYP